MLGFELGPWGVVRKAGVDEGGREEGWWVGGCEVEIRLWVLWVWPQWEQAVSSQIRLSLTSSHFSAVVESKQESHLRHFYYT